MENALGRAKSCCWSAAAAATRIYLKGSRLDWARSIRRRGFTCQVDAERERERERREDKKCYEIFFLSFFIAASGCGSVPQKWTIPGLSFFIIFF